MVRQVAQRFVCGAAHGKDEEDVVPRLYCAASWRESPRKSAFVLIVGPTCIACKDVLKRTDFVIYKIRCFVLMQYESYRVPVWKQSR